KIRTYEPPPRHYATGVVRDVDATLTDAQIADNLSFVCLGQVRQPVTLFKEGPYSAVSAVAMDIEKQPASRIQYVAAAVAVMTTQTDVLRKKCA
ncbi:hypothetical protein HPB47_003229, partial [Ixodes persulcatus]